MLSIGAEVFTINEADKLTDWPKIMKSRQTIIKQKEKKEIKIKGSLKYRTTTFA